LQDAAAIAIHHLVVERVTHRDGRVVDVALAPSLGEIALQQLDVGDAIDDALARIGGEILREIGKDFGRREAAQPGEVFRAIRALHLAEDLLEGIEVLGSEPNLIGAGCARGLRRRATAAATESHQRTGGTGRVIAQRRTAGERGLAAALPPRPQ